MYRFLVTLYKVSFVNIGNMNYTINKIYLLKFSILVIVYTVYCSF